LDLLQRNRVDVFDQSKDFHRELKHVGRLRKKVAKGLDGAKPVYKIAEVISSQRKRERLILEKSRRVQGYDAVASLGAASQGPRGPNGRAPSATKAPQPVDEYGSASQANQRGSA